MRCPVCGKWNKASLPRCFVCGAPLERAPSPELPEMREPERAPAAERNVPPRRVERFEEETGASMSMSRVEIEDRKKRGRQYQEMLRKKKETQPPKRTLPVQIAKPSAEKKSRRNIFAQLARRWSRWGRKTRDIRTRPSMRVAARLLWYVLLVGFAVGGYFGYARAMEYVVEQSRQAAPDPVIAIEKTTVSVREGTATVDKGAHDIVFYGDEGDVIFLREFGKSYIVTGGKAVATKLDEELIPEFPDAGQAEVQVEVSPQISKMNGMQIAMDPITFTVDIPMSEVARIKPDKSQIETTDAMYTIKLRVPESSTVTLNNENLSDLRDSSGQILHNVTVEPIGDNVYTLMVAQPHHQPYVENIILTRNSQEIPLSFSNTLPESASAARLAISGTVMIGAEITVESEHSGEVEYDKDKGEFTFEAQFSRIGENKIQVRATKSGLADSVITHTITYVPSLDEYSRRAWALEYSELLGNVANNQGRIYACTGTVTEILQTEPQTFTFDISEDPAKKQLLVIESATAMNAVVGEKYRIFADVQEEYEGLPLLVARHVYSVE